MGVITIEQFLNYKKIKEVKHLITKNQYCEIYKIIEYVEYNDKQLQKKMMKIECHFIERLWVFILEVVSNTR